MLPTELIFPVLDYCDIPTLQRCKGLCSWIRKYVSQIDYFRVQDLVKSRTAAKCNGSEIYFDCQERKFRWLRGYFGGGYECRQEMDVDPKAQYIVASGCNGRDSYPFVGKAVTRHEMVNIIWKYLKSPNKESIDTSNTSQML